MRIRYIGSGQPTDNAICEAFGLTFERGEWRDDIETIPHKLLKNPTFEVEGGDTPSVDDEVADLRAQLDAKGVKYHPRNNAESLKALLADADQA